MQLLGDDIIVGEATEFLSAQANIRERPVCGTVGRRPSTWPNGVVPYELPRDLTEKDREDILTAIEIWNEATEISFRPATPQDLDLLTFVYYYDDSEGSQCSSYLGRKGGLQEIRMSYSGCGVRILVHELGHALGLAHEHTRCDRDHYIEVLWDNILPTHHHNFHKSCRADSPFGDYDWNSVMHYNSNTFTKNGQPTLRSRKGDTIQVVVRPSEGDVAAVNYLVELSRRRN